MHTLVSVIVPNYNSGEWLQQCLEAILQSDWPEFEVIVVDDASSDDGLSRLEPHPRVTCLQLEHNVGAGPARNAGAEIARGSILMMVDADVLVHPQTIGKAVRALEADPGLGAVFGSYDDQPTHPGFLSQYRNLLHHWVHQTSQREATTFWTGCGAIRTALFEQLGGFRRNDTQRYVEDIELGYRISDSGSGIALLKDMWCTHMKPWTLVSMIKTDLFYRAIPWMRMLLERPGRAKDLNINHRARIATLAAGLLGLALVFSIAWPILLWLAVLMVLVIVGTQWGFYRFLRRSRGLWFALRAVPAQLVFFACCAVSIPLAYVEYYSRKALPVGPG